MLNSNNMKICRICKLDKSFEELTKHKRMSFGCDSLCLECGRKTKNEKYKDEAKNRKAYQLKYRLENQEKVKESKQKGYQKNKKAIRAKQKIYRDNKRKTDPLFKLKDGIAHSIRQSFKRTYWCKTNKTSIILGCTYQEFKAHIELQFKSWMTWENHGKYNGELNFGWDIDHIIPVSLATSEKELIDLNHYTNFQPLCSKINRDVKKNKLIQKN